MADSDARQSITLCPEAKYLEFDYVPVEQTVAKQFVKPVDCRTGGEGGIRTPDTLSGMPVFKTGVLNHSTTSPH
jgi:hypothetical protein